MQSTKKKINYLILFISCIMVALTFSNCGDDDDGPPQDFGDIAVNTEKDCNTTPNLIGDDVYAYRLDSFLNEPSLEVGGHPKTGSGDFTVDLITRGDDIVDGTYYLDHSRNQYAGLIYSPNEDPNEEYISIPNQPGSVTLLNLTYKSDGKTVHKFKVNFVNVKMAYNGDTICASGVIKMNHL